jgi:hypothetical protein
MKRSLEIFCLLVSAALAIGCGKTGVDISGSLVIDGKPLRTEGSEQVKIALNPKEMTMAESLTPTERTALTATMTDDGTFAFADVLPGAYWVRVSHFDRFPYGDKLVDHFRDYPESIEWIVEEKPSENVIEINPDWYLVVD